MMVSRLWIMWWTGLILWTMLISNPIISMLLYALEGNHDFVLVFPLFLVVHCSWIESFFPSCIRFGYSHDSIQLWIYNKSNSFDWIVCYGGEGVITIGNENLLFLRILFLKISSLRSMICSSHWPFLCMYMTIWVS